MPNNLVLLIMFLTVVKFPWEGVQMKASWQSVRKPEEALFTTPFIMKLRCLCVVAITLIEDITPLFPGRSNNLDWRQRRSGIEYV